MSENEDWGGTHPDSAEDEYEKKRFENYRRKRLGSEEVLERNPLASDSELEPWILPAEDGTLTTDLRGSRKEQAMKSGTEVYYVGCPLCGLNRPLKSARNDEFLTREGIKMGQFIFREDKIIQVRKGGGRGIGFFHVGEKDLEKVAVDHPEIFKNLKFEAQKLIDRINEIENS